MEQANEAATLKDRLDEYRHDAEKLKKAENVIEKYRKKLEDGADLRRILKVNELNILRAILYIHIDHGFMFNEYVRMQNKKIVPLLNVIEQLRKSTIKYLNLNH